MKYCAFLAKTHYISVKNLPQEGSPSPPLKQQVLDQDKPTAAEEPSQCTLVFPTIYYYKESWCSINMRHSISAYNIKVLLVVNIMKVKMLSKYFWGKKLGGHFYGAIFKRGQHFWFVKIVKILEGLNL